jgi:hypothetical protein
MEERRVTEKRKEKEVRGGTGRERERSAKKSNQPEEEKIEQLLLNSFGHDLTRKREQALSEEKLGSADKTIRLWPN